MEHHIAISVLEEKVYDYAKEIQANEQWIDRINSKGPYADKDKVTSLHAENQYWRDRIKQVEDTIMCLKNGQ